MTDLSNFEAERLNTRSEILESGLNPYPAKVNPDSTLANVRDDFAELEVDARSGEVRTIVGRVMTMRKSGKIAFATLQSGEGVSLQILLSAMVLGEGDVELGRAAIKEWAHLCDLGDFLEVTGEIITSKSGELSVEVTNWNMASKAITPLPYLHSELSDEYSVRERYASLVTSQSSRDLVRNRSKIVSSIRRTLDSNEFVEIETPVLQSVHGGASARPFKTHLNAFDQEMNLRIALELNLKKAVVGGLERVYEIGRIFRNEGVDSSHSPEFTMLESYEAFGDMYSAADTTQEVIRNAATSIGKTSVTSSDGSEIDLMNDWEWKSFYSLISDAVGREITTETTLDEMLELAERNNVKIKEGVDSAGRVALELFDELVESNLIQPTFVHSYPAEAQPLARPSDDDSGIVLAWDLYIDGVECGTGFTELVDPVVQEKVLREQSLRASNGDPEAMEVDDSFLRALRFGCPPMGGLGIGVDRLVMLLTESNIREAILFPLIRS